MRMKKVVFVGGSNIAEVWGRRMLRGFYSFFPKNNAFLGIFWVKFLFKNAFLTTAKP